MVVRLTISVDSVLEGIDEAIRVGLSPVKMATIERDRMLELRVKFNVDGMHGVLLHKTPNPRDGPKSKKLAQPSWKTILPLDM